MSAEAARSLPLAWKAATAVCPYCTGDGCERCGDSGDLMRHLLEQAYRQGRDEALVKLRDVYRVSLLAGRQVSDGPIPVDLKRSLGL